MNFLDRQKTILGLGLPIIAGMLSQSVLNLVDALLVGQLGEASLAGVGIGSYANFVAISLILGLSSAVQTLVARHKGAGQHSSAASPVHWGILISFLFALPLSIFLIANSHIFVATMTSDSAVQDISESYFDYRTAAMLAVGLNLSLRGWWNGTKRPAIYFKVLITTHVLNVLISYCLIFGEFGLPRLGAAGAGLGTAIALYAGTLLNGFLVFRDARSAGLFKIALSQASSIYRVIRLAVPHSIQQFFVALAICVLIWVIGQLGTNEQAIAHVLINLSLFLILPAVGFGVACTSLVSHALGENKPEEAARWGWNVIQTALVCICLLSTPLILFPEAVLSLFLQTDELVHIATLPLQLTAIAICVDTATIVLTQALLGVGANRTVLLISTFGQWCFFLPLAWLFGPMLGYGILGIWIVQLLHRSLSSLVFMRIWSLQHWQKVKI